MSWESYVRYHAETLYMENMYKTTKLGVNNVQKRSRQCSVLKSRLTMNSLEQPAPCSDSLTLVHLQ